MSKKVEVTQDYLIQLYRDLKLLNRNAAYYSDKDIAKKQANKTLKYIRKFYEGELI